MLVGRMDAARARQTMEKLLAAVSGGSVEAVIVDITGTVAPDGEVVESLLAMARAVALLGAECVFVGISPDVAVSLTAVGVDLSKVTTRRDLRSGIDYARRRTASD